MKNILSLSTRLGALLLLLLLGSSCSNMEKAWNDTKKVATRVYEGTKVLLALQGCSTNKDCTHKNQTLCHPTKKKCVACLQHRDCVAVSKDYPVCDATLNLCVQCQNNKDCHKLSRELRYCYGQRCVECLQSKDCQPWQMCASAGSCQKDPNALFNSAFIAFGVGLFFPLFLLLLGPVLQEQLFPIGLASLALGPLFGLLVPGYLGLVDLTFFNTLLIGTSLCLAVGVGCLAAVRWDKAGFALGLLLQSTAYHALLLQYQDIVGPNPILLKYFVLSGLVVSIVLFSVSIDFSEAKRGGKEQAKKKGKTVLALFGVVLTAVEIVGLVLQLMNYFG